MAPRMWKVGEHSGRDMRLARSLSGFWPRAVAFRALAAMPVLLVLSHALAGHGAQALQTFTVAERFGVAHPEQIIDFDVAAAVDVANVRVLGPGGAEVAFQLLENGKKLAVRTDLPAG